MNEFLNIIIHNVLKLSYIINESYSLNLSYIINVSYSLNISYINKLYHILS
jgi:hypothetical protein